MKKFLLSIYIITSVCVIESCKKSPYEISTKGNSVANRPIRTETVTPADIDSWFANMASLKPAPVLLKAAQQATINGQQVVRIP